MQARANPVRALTGVPRRRLAALMGLSVAKAVGLVLVAYAVAKGVSAVADGDDRWRDALGWGAIGIGLRAVSLWGLQVASVRTAMGVKRDLRTRLVARVVERSQPRIGADAILATRQLDDLDDYFTVFLPALIAAATLPVLIGVLILAADPLSALVIALTLPLIPVFMILIGLHTRDRVAEQADALARLSDHLVELARGLPVLVGLGRVGEQRRALGDISERHRRASMTTLRTAFVSAFALELIATVSVALVAVLIGLRLVSGDLSLFTGLFVLILAPECFLPLREVGTAFHASEDGLEALRRVDAVLEDPAGEPTKRRHGDTVGVADLTVHYPGRRDPAVSALGFVAPIGEVTLLAGPSGCGKSTVLGLLAGIEPADAHITGTVQAPEDLAWLPQHPRPVAATALEEIRAYGIEDREEALGLLGRVGLVTVADTDPARLSPGELRRLAFARILARVARGANLVLLDEPTAHLDPANAALIRAEIAGLRRNVTVVVASHDPHVQRLADEVIRLAPGTDHPGQTNDQPDATAPDPTGSMPRRDAVPVVSDGRRRRSLVRRELAAVLRPVAWRFVAAAGVAALAAGFAIALTAVSAWLIVRAGEGAALMYLMVAIVGVRFFGVGRAALHYVDRLLTHDAVFRALTPLRLRLWDGLARRGPADKALLGAGGTLGSLVADADAVRDLTPRVVTPVLTAVLVWIGTTIALGLLLPVAGVVSAVIGAVGIVVPSLVAVWADRRAGARADATRAELSSAVASLFNAAPDVRANGVAGPAFDAVEALDARQERAEHRGAWAAGLGEMAVVVVSGLFAFTLLGIGATEVEQGTISVAVLSVLVLVPLGLVEPFRAVVDAALRWPVLAQVLGRVGAITQAPAEETPGVATLETAEVLTLERVGYRYPGADRAVFADLDAEASPGNWLVVTGPSGSGKSTLLALLLRYVDPVTGRYVIDGLDAQRFVADSVRARVAWCPQEAHLFDSTLRANLLLARPHDDAPDEGEMRAVLDDVGLGDLLDELADGLDTPIGSAGAKLSGGQRQRVAVARTLLTRADAVLVDEPTAHLDEEASTRLMADLRRGLADRTTVLVTHRALTIEPGDRLVQLGSHTAPRPDLVGADSPQVSR